MRFGNQQAIALTVSIGCLSLPRIASLFTGSDVTWDLPYVLQWTMTLLFNLAFSDTFFGSRGILKGGSAFSYTAPTPKPELFHEL